MNTARLADEQALGEASSPTPGRNITTSLRTARTIASLQIRILLRDPWFLVIMFAMPLVVMPLLKSTMRLSLMASGNPDVSGAEQVVPGQIVLFGFMVGGSAAFSLFREHGWRTWDRLRASGAQGWALLAGFAVPWVVIHVAYQAILFGAGVAFIGLDMSPGDIPRILVVALGFGSTIVCLVLLAAATFRTINQVQALVNVGAMAFGGLGGAFVPLDQLPGWAQVIAPFTPSYWAMEGYNEIFLGDGDPGRVATAAAILLGAAAVLFVLAARRFKVDETKEFFA